jgi:hypothetical protein
MLAIYIVLGWSIVGCVAALLMGRAIAVTAGEDRVSVPGPAEPAMRTGSLESAKAA